MKPDDDKLEDFQIAPHVRGRSHTRGRGGLVAALQEGVTRPVSTSSSDLREYATNASGLVRKVPSLVVTVTSAREISHVLRVTRDARVPVNIRGTGLSFGDQGLSDGGVLIVNDMGPPDVRLNSDGSVEATTRTTWRSLECELKKRGRAIPVLTNYLDTSVGGTLSAGGYGARSIRYGGQVDLVRRLRLILPDGNAVWCSREANRDLFRYGLASIGRVGVLDRVVLETAPHNAETSLTVRVVPTLERLVENVDWLADSRAEGLDIFSGQHTREGVLATFGVRGDHAVPVPLRGSGAWRNEYDWPHSLLREQPRTFLHPSCHFVWADYCVDGANAGRFARFVDREVVSSPAYRAHGGRILVLAVSRPERRTAIPFAPTGYFSGAVFGFGLYFVVRRGDQAGLAEVQALHARALHTCLSCGGRPYLAGWLTMSERDKRSVYGRDHVAMRQLLEVLDPSGLFNRGLLS